MLPGSPWPMARALVLFGLYAVELAEPTNTPLTYRRAVVPSKVATRCVQLLRVMGGPSTLTILLPLLIQNDQIL